MNVVIPEWLQWIILLVGLGFAAYLLSGIGAILHGIGHFFEARAEDIEARKPPVKVEK